VGRQDKSTALEIFIVIVATRVHFCSSDFLLGKFGRLELAPRAPLQGYFIVTLKNRRLASCDHRTPSGFVSVSTVIT
jgi:hypothetical protein